VAELIAEVGRGEEEGVVFETHGVDGGGATCIRDGLEDALDK
jgi:hypothetical protein